MKKLFILTLITIGIDVAAKDLKYPVSEISENLKKGANLVYRVDEMSFTILSKSRAIQKSHVVITFLNEKAKREATRIVGYSKLVKVNSISGAVYDAAGEQVKKLKNSDIRDQSATGSSLYTDDRVKIADLSHTSYPYTLEFESEIEYKFLFYIPTWYVVPGEQKSVQKSRLTVTFTNEATPRFKVYNTNVKEVVDKLPDDKQSWTWTFENIPAVEREPFSPPLSETTPVIEIAPGNFEYENYSGTMEDWISFGKWISTVNKGRDGLPPEAKAKVAELTRGKTMEEKVRVLYQFLQDKTRYVSIQIGIGGQQPFEAAVVDKMGYGDCKALSNYMVSMLKEAGVDANYVLIRAGSNEQDIDIEFPSTQFNHAVAAVPMGKDTLWLECTSQTNPFGYSGRFTGDRHALMITEQGGKIVRTPRYPVEVNRQERKARVIVSKDGNAKASVKTVYSGLQYENDNLDYYIQQSKEEQKKWIQENTDIPSFEVSSFTISEKRDIIPQATIDLDLSVRSFASVNGKRLFLAPNLMNRGTYVPKKLDSRKTPIVLSFPYVDEDVVEITFPEELYPEFVPPKAHFESKFGTYDGSYEMESGKLVYTRKLKMNKGVFPSESYQELIDFYKNINKADNAKLVLLSKT